VSRANLYFATRLNSGGPFACNACGRNVSGFYVYGGRPFGCPLCGCSARERFVIEAIHGGALRLPSRDGAIMHVAPGEKGLCAIFKDHADYLPCDLHPGIYRHIAAKKVDLMQMNELGLFDLIYASHVIEHVPDDRAVLRSMFDHLKPNGQVWILVPMHDGPTEDGDVSMSPLERERRFQQWDHLRIYGIDVVDRMREAGFTVEIVDYDDIDIDRRESLGLSEQDRVFVGTRR
jgi:SAM-dependent methyltransferase